MVRERGNFSNTDKPHIEPKPNLSQDDLDTLFRTLSDWNEYLEKDVPYFRDTLSGGQKSDYEPAAPKPQEPRL